MESMTPEAIAAAASLLVAARRTRHPLDGLPEHCRPTQVEEARSIQLATVAQLGDRIAGWKVGGVVDGALAYGVLLASRLVPSGGSEDARDMPLLGMEAE